MYSAEKMDLRDHLAQSLQLSTETVDKLCTRPLENEVNSLELIMFKVMHRPDGSFQAATYMRKYSY